MKQAFSNEEAQRDGTVAALSLHSDEFVFSVRFESISNLSGNDFQLTN